MNTSQSKPRGRGLMRLWHRFQIWRAMQLYRSVLRLEQEAREAAAEADRLIVTHAEPPQPRLPLGDD
jgi:hypothetical protein